MTHKDNYNFVNNLNQTYFQLSCKEPIFEPSLTLDVKNSRCEKSRLLWRAVVNCRSKEFRQSEML